VPERLPRGLAERTRLRRARALVLEPRVLLFDEPLSNLDAKLRRRVREEIRDLQQKLRLSVVYVTHDQEEALAVSDQIIVMDNAVIAQQGTPTELYREPASRFVADFIGDANLVKGTLKRIDERLAALRLGGLEFALPHRGATDGEVNVELLENVRGRDVFIIQSTNPPAENLMELLLLVDAARRASAASIRSWRARSQSIAASSPASVASSTASSSPSVVSPSRRVADSFEPGLSSRWQTIAATKSRSRLRSRRMIRSSPSRRSVPSTAATCPCGSERSIRNDCSGASSVSPASTRRTASIASAGSREMLATVSLRTRFPSRTLRRTK